MASDRNADKWDVATRRRTNVFPVVFGITVALVASVLLHLVALRALSILKSQSSKPRIDDLPISSLRLNADKPISCPRVLVLRTPKSASSALASLFFLRRAAAGAKCARKFFPTGRYLPVGAYTLNETTIFDVPQTVIQSHSSFIAHMNYTPTLRQALNESRFFRLTSLRSARTRAESLFAYEVSRPHIELRPALEYLGAPRLLPAESASDLLTPNISNGSIDRQIQAVLKHWHLIVIAELWDKSLAVLMYDLDWRIVDILSPPLNVQDPAAKRAALVTSHAYRIDHPEDEALLRWTLGVDDKLYRLAVQVLHRRFARLPSEFRNVPNALRKLRKSLARACPTQPQQKHFSKRDVLCIRNFRRSLLRAAGINGWAR